MRRGREVEPANRARVDGHLPEMLVRRDAEQWCFVGSSRRRRTYDGIVGKLGGGVDGRGRMLPERVVFNCVKRN